jgi:hypothetical protein
MFAIPQPTWIINDHEVLLMDRQSGCAVVLIEEMRFSNEEAACDITIFLRPIGRYRFWKALLGGYGGIHRVGEAYPNKPLPEVTRDVARALTDIGVLDHSPDKMLSRLFSQVTIANNG